MGKAVIILSTVILILLVILSLQLPKIQAADQRVAEAEDLAITVRQLLQTMDIRCTASVRDVVGIRNCISPVLEQNNFETEAFREFNERTEEAGVFVIRNDGVKTYDGLLFSLSKNGEQVANGCHITTDILPDYTCRFDLPEPCIEGDVYEISYADNDVSRLVTRTCR
jgi:hypothetical protein